jgi:Uma2 family endonuclease
MVFMDASITPRRFTVHEYHRMGRAGILRDERVELIDGEVVRMSPIGRSHAAVVDRLNEVQPDLALLTPVPDFYASRHPGPADVLCLIEVATSSRTYDRRVKIPLYARRGVREAWLLLLDRRVVEIYRSPSRKGYRDLTEMRDGRLSPLAFPGLALPVAELLG